MPAEWEQHDATWLGWPLNPTDWPGKIEPIHWVYGEITRKLAVGERVHIIVAGAAHERKARSVLQRAGVDIKRRVRFFRMAMNRGWTRDSGPIFLRRAQPKPEVAIVKFRFNAWAKYADWQKDARIPEQTARALKLPLLRAQLDGRDVVLEGGAIDVNGRGSLLTTEECLLDQKTQARNPGFARAETEAALKQNLGVSNIMWLGRGIAGDDTHGHVDDLCRFVNPTTLLMCREKNPRDANYRALEENWERAGSLRLEDGGRPELLELPMPEPLHFDGQRLPASYANFYISNRYVLMPTFNDPNDYRALGLLREVFPARQVAGIHAVDLVWGFGTLHCLTQQQPSAT
jgi:agmatine deiminase